MVIAPGPRSASKLNGAGAEFVRVAAARGLEVSDAAWERALASSDAGNYRIPPAALVRPRNADDVSAALEIARELGVPVNSRGAGTSCAGNAIGPGVVLDYTRHMNAILDVNVEERWADVQPGVVQAQLQAAAAPAGLRFGPDPSTSNRCTIGGMIGNNACGPRATAYGKTADNVLALEAIDGLGRTIHAGQGRDGLAQVPGLAALADTQLAYIRRTFGTFSRQVSGYSLEFLTPERGHNLASFLVGTESTLATVTRARVRLVPIPAAPVLVALGYPDMIAAADDVPALLAHRPIAIEGMDARLVEVVRRHRGPGAVPELPAGSGWLLIEVGGEHLPTVEDALAAAAALARDASTDAVMIYPPGSQAAALWRIRADGAGLGGRTPVGEVGSGGAQAWPGWEDAAVPPARLGAYLRDFTALMRDHGVDGLLYGHFGDGCVHVRLDLPLGSAAGTRRARAFLLDAADTVARHGGSLSGEHGDGRARSELLTHMYPPRAIHLFAQVKTLFDPDNLMNPGVLTSPVGPGGVDRLDAHLRRPAAREISAAGGFAYREDGGSWTSAIHRCTGVGKCHADGRGAGQFMCPTYLATGEERDSTRGRARILQEASNGTLVTLDSDDVAQILDRCLACKACSADCPTGVDMAAWRSEYLYRRYRHRLRPRTHYTLGWLPTWLRLIGRVPGAARAGNALLSIGPLRRASFALAGLDPTRPMPGFARVPFSRWAEGAGWPQAGARGPRDFAREGAHPMRGSRGPVLVWADSFSLGLDGAGAQATVRLLADLGFEVLIAPQDACCGLTWVTTGQLDQARARMRRLLARLAPWAMNGVPIVGVEPSCTAVLRDDLARLLPDDPRAHAVKEATLTLAELLWRRGCAGELSSLAGTRVLAQPHCHHYSVMGWQADRALLESLGADVIEVAGCCGLAGNYGMEAAHHDMSVRVAENALLPALRAHPEALVLADGFSCRTQISALGGREARHLATLLRVERAASSCAARGRNVRE